jgi:hypothetical protein
LIASAILLALKCVSRLRHLIGGERLAVPALPEADHALVVAEARDVDAHDERRAAVVEHRLALLRLPRSGRCR